MKNIILLVFLSLVVNGTLLAQGRGGMKVGPKYEAYVDSIKQSDYKWKFPIWGKRLSKRGFDLQYPFGFMLNPFVGSQKIDISQLEVGINDLPKVSLDNVVKFGEVKAVAKSISVRPDVWILPFLDLYGIAGVISSDTHVELTAPVNYSTVQNFKGSIFGLGTTLAGGYHGFLIIVDVNHTWTNLDKIQGTIKTTMVSPRLGYSFLFHKKPYQNIAFWVGAPSILVNRTTEGEVNLSDLSHNVSSSDLQSIVNGSAPWYQPLTAEQKNVFKEIAQKMLDQSNGHDVGDAVIHYSLVKKPVNTISMCVGVQFQLNHHWQFRTESNILGGRTSLLVSANYRWRHR